MTNSEFVDKEGNILRIIGESKIVIAGEGITRECWGCVDGKKISSSYRIKKESDSKFYFECDNSEQGVKRGDLDIDRNIIYSKFYINNSSLNGYEIFIKDDDECTVYGSLYDDKELLKSWRTIMVRIS